MLIRYNCVNNDEGKVDCVPHFKLWFPLIKFFELRRQCRIHLLFFEVCQLKHLLNIWRNISKVMVVLNSNIRPLVWSCCFAFAGSQRSVSGFWTAPPPPSCPAPEEQVAAKHGKVSPLLYLEIFIFSPLLYLEIFLFSPRLCLKMFIY